MNTVNKTAEKATSVISPSYTRINHMRIAVSYYCSLRCKHCYVPELNRTKYKSLLESSQLSLQQIHSFIDMLTHDFSLTKISVTGGEAMLNIVWPRTSSVMNYGLDRGLEVQLNTSGSGQVSIKTLAESIRDRPGNLLLQISLDGLDEGFVDDFRGMQGAMARARNCIKDAVKYGINVQVRYTATQDNLYDVERCYKMVSEIGVNTFAVKPMFAAGVARENADVLLTDADVVKDMQLELLALSIDNRTKLRLPQPVFLQQNDIPLNSNVEIIHCECGGSGGYLSTNGDIYPCSYLVGAPNAAEFVLGNIQDPTFDFQTAWLRPSTYALFREDRKEANCTAQNTVNSSITKELQIAHAQCG